MLAVRRDGTPGASWLGRHGAAPCDGEEITDAQERVKQIYESGQVAFGTNVAIPSPIVVEVAAQAASPSFGSTTTTSGGR